MGSTARLTNRAALKLAMDSVPGRTNGHVGPVELAERINRVWPPGVSHQFLSKLRDPDSPPYSCSPELAEQIAAALGLHADLLFSMPVISDKKGTAA